MQHPIALGMEALSAEMQLMLAFLRIEEGQEQLTAIQRELLLGLDWDSFFRLAQHHRVHPYLYHKLKNMREVPEEVIHKFHSSYFKNTFQMLYFSGEMELIGRQFSESNIRCLFLKGPVIAQDLYGDISLRTSCDLDLLLPLDDLSKAEALLREQGYVKDDYIRTILNDWKWRHHHVVFFHPKKGIKVELHWRLNPAPAREPAFNELWARKRISSLTKYPIYYLGREDLFLFLVSHGARHGWSRIRWLLDIRQLLLQQPDAINLTRLLRKHRYYYTGGQALALASGLLSAPIEPMLQSMEKEVRSRRLANEAMFYLERLVNLHSGPVPDEIGRFHKRHQFSLLTPGQKMLFVLSFLFPYPEDAETLPLPKNLHFLYFPLRPVLWAWRKANGGHK